MNDDLEQKIRTLINNVLPGPLMKWMELLDGAERAGRIKRAKMSVLRYGIQRYIQSQLPEIDPVFRLDIDPIDDSITIGGRHPTEPDQNWALLFEYPIWMIDFFENDDNFELLVFQPHEPVKLGEVLQRIYEWCYQSERYHALVV